ncbi:MAG: hypothetical protein ACTHLT_05850 [Devosia sp.]
MRENLTIRFDASAPGGQALVQNALRAIDAERSFVLPPGWVIVGVSTDGKVKTLRLKFRGYDDVEAQRSSPIPPHLSAEATLD